MLPAGKWQRKLSDCIHNDLIARKKLRFLSRFCLQMGRKKYRVCLQVHHLLNTLERYTIAIPFRKEAKGKPSPEKSNSFFIDLLSYVCRSRTEYRAASVTDQVQVPETGVFINTLLFHYSFSNKKPERKRFGFLFEENFLEKTEQPPVFP